ncbi:glycosyltransferase family 2 protein [Stappia sp. ES.058]|uniref:glycosyltransferase family 2 protein n=1 Tax=Stappia sp. ES.058 TaxID=1881061 RepID=UPI001FCDB7C3|nr:glycosyltransferase family 2 protein [Stappia sp. ES.058]
MPDICVAICTCDRPNWLGDLLDGLARQETDLRFDVVVVDNGIRSARAVVLERAAAGALQITHARLRDRGLAAARNRSLSLACESGAPWIACLDDDEVPGSEWLSALHARALETGADLIFAPVQPEFETSPPRWAVAGGFFVKTGEIACSSNMMLRTAILPGDARNWYQPAFGVIGGEDREFLARLERGGAQVATAHQAVVREHIPAARLRLGYMFQRGLRDGYAEVTILRQAPGSPGSRAVAALGIAAKKFGFAHFHLAGAVMSRAHLASAVADTGTVCGIGMCLAGRSMRFYGAAGEGLPVDDDGAIAVSLDGPPPMSARPPPDASRVCVCLCTCDRLALLPALFAALEKQTLSGRLTVFVADNGRQPADAVVAACGGGALDLVYQRVREVGVSSARNAAMARAVDGGFEFLAFLDDDEVPETAWLEELLATALSERCDIVCGPVEPVFARPPPAWALAGRFFCKSGDTLCSSNLLLRTAALPRERNDWFDAEFGETGGGDREFLKRLVAGGARTAVARRAVVREHVPDARLALRYMFARGLRDGMTDVQILMRRKPSAWGVWLDASGIAVTKAGYGLNHLIWSTLRPGRLASALSDAGHVCGIVLRLFGRRVRLYGRGARPGAGGI